MIIKRTSNYDKNRKSFIVINYCCAKMGRSMGFYPYWSINNEGEMDCGDMECGIGGNYCCYCGEKITIQ